MCGRGVLEIGVGWEEFKRHSLNGAKQRLVILIAVNGSLSLEDSYSARLVA